MDSGLTDVVGKLHPIYQSGFDSGSNGREPPMDLNRVTRPKQMKREDPFGIFSFDDNLREILNQSGIRRIFDQGIPTEEVADPAKASFRQGYVDGLTHFMQSKGIDVSSTGLFQGVSIINADGLVGFVRGARLEAPNIPRNYRGILERYLEQDEPDFSKKNRFKNMVTQEWYRLGFVVGVAREHGVVIKGLQVPMDDASYTAFRQGLNAEVRPISFEGLFRSIKKDLLLNKTESPYEAELRTYEFFDSQTYHTGLQLWLKSQGVQGVETWAIRHPEALRAFKAALSGQTLAEYESIPIKPDFGLSGDMDFGVDKHLIKRVYYPNYKKRLFDEPREPSTAEIGRQQGQSAYNLGKAVRLKR